MIMRGRKWWVALAVVAMASTAGAAGFDDFDSYAAGSNLLGASNGQFTYMTPAPSGSAMGGTNTLQAVADGSSASAPNVLRFDDNADNLFASFRARLMSASAIDLSAAGSSAQIGFDFKTINGFQGRMSASIRAMWSADADAGAEDYIDNTHTAGIADGGLYFLNNGNVLGALTNRYQTDTWYHWDMTATRRGDGGIDYLLDVRRVSDNFSLDGPIAFNGASGPAGRPWLTGVGFYTSSNANETLLLDNLSITPEPGTALFVLTGLSLAVRRRRN